MISIDLVRRTLDRRISRIDQFLNQVTPNNRYERFSYQSSAISSLWQAWVLHNRAVFNACLAGKLVANGRTLGSPLSELDTYELLYYAQQYSEGNSPKVGRKVKSHLSEPNWGDTNKIINICSGANFEGSSYIMSCFGLAIRMKDLQLCRNSCAHLTPGQLDEFNKSRIRYKDNSYLHPSDMMNWIDPETNLKVWDSWRGEMLTITELISTC